MPLSWLILRLLHRKPLSLNLEEELCLFPECDIAAETILIFSMAAIY